MGLMRLMGQMGRYFLPSDGYRYLLTASDGCRVAVERAEPSRLSWQPIDRIKAGQNLRGPAKGINGFARLVWKKTVLSTLRKVVKWQIGLAVNYSAANGSEKL